MLIIIAIAVGLLVVALGFVLMAHSRQSDEIRRAVERLEAERPLIWRQ